jgi:hypothetical protein
VGLLSELVFLLTNADRKSGPAWSMQPLLSAYIASYVAERVAAKVARQELPEREFEQANLSIR